MGRLVRVCTVAELPVDSMQAIEVDGRRVLVANAGGQLHAVDGTCTHEEADLSMGFLAESRVTCPLHLSQFDLATGAVLNPPATQPLRTYKVKITADTIFVEID